MADDLNEIRETLWQYESDLRHPPSDSSRERRIDRIRSTLAIADALIKREGELREALEEYGAHTHCRWISAGDPDLATCECGFLEKRRALNPNTESK